MGTFIKNIFKDIFQKIQLKIILYLVSIELFLAILIIFILLIIASIFIAEGQAINSNEYLNALKNRELDIETVLESNFSTSYIYATDQVNRDTTYENDKHIYVGTGEMECFLDTEGRPINSDGIETSFDCLEYSSSERKNWLFHYNTFEEYAQTSQKGLYFSYPVYEPYSETAGFNSDDSVHQGVHSGIDLVPIANQNIKSISNGEVIDVETECPIGNLGDMCGGGFGNNIKVKTLIGETEYKIIYGHLSKVDVEIGDEVSMDEDIGVVGNSGNSTGTHLHLQIEIKNGSEFVPVDPKLFLNELEPVTNAEKIEIMHNAGIDEEDYSYVDFIVSHESSWDYQATNVSSGAYGLCQALPPEKMAISGEDWKVNPNTQMTWCNSYALDRYGSWSEAYSFWITNHWW